MTKSELYRKLCKMYPGWTFDTCANMTPGQQLAACDEKGFAEPTITFDDMDAYAKWAASR